MLIRRVTVASPTCKTNDSEQAALIPTARQPHRSCLRWICRLRRLRRALTISVCKIIELSRDVGLAESGFALPLVSERRVMFGGVNEIEILMIPCNPRGHLAITGCDGINDRLMGASDRRKIQLRLQQRHQTVGLDMQR